MKHFKSNEIVELGPEELDVKLKFLREELFKLKSQSKSGSVPNPSQIKIIRRNIARILTQLRLKENNSKK